MASEPYMSSNDLDETDDLKDLFPIERLPAELLDIIVRFLPFEDQMSFRVVNKNMENIVTIGMEFLPYLDKSTIEACKAFLSETAPWKRYQELRIGDLSSMDWSWIQSPKLDPVGNMYFVDQITEEALGAIRHLLKNSKNLVKLDFKRYNFVKFQMGQLTEAEDLDETFQHISTISIKGNLTSNFITPNLVFADPLGPQLEFTTFSCQDLAKFTSLKSLELLMMGGASLENIAQLPISLKHLQLATGLIPRADLNILLERLVNLEKLIIQCCMLGNALQLLLATMGIDPNADIPLDRATYSKLLHQTKIKYFHYLPIAEITAKQYVASTGIRGSNIVSLKTFAKKDGFTLKIKRQEGFERE